MTKTKQTKSQKIWKKWTLISTKWWQLIKYKTLNKWLNKYPFCQVSIYLSSVKTIIRNWKEHGQAVKLPWSDRPHKPSESREKHEVTMTTLKALQASAAEIGDTAVQVLYRFKLYAKVAMRRTPLKKTPIKTWLARTRTVRWPQEECREKMASKQNTFERL